MQKNEETQRRLNQFRENLDELYRLLGIADKDSEIKAIELEMASNSFWDNQKESSRIVERLKTLKDDVDTWRGLMAKVRDCCDLLELSDEGYDEEIAREVQALEKSLDQFELRILFGEKFDGTNAYVEINSGAGGTEACDWVQMLFRMYFRWAEDKKFKISVLDEVRGDEAGLKSITMFIEGVRAYGYLKSETGVHRLVRISPFDANKRRHTSFASVAVYPQIQDTVAVGIRPEDLKIDTFRAGGAGGQHVNRTDSAVRITHIPTGIIVSCQNERSQHQNKQVALGILKAKLFERKEEERQQELSRLSGKKRKIEWGSQIRSYVLCPYLLVKDHRTNLEDHNAWAVLDGRLDDFMVAYLKSIVEHTGEDNNA